ncbi:MAG: hypothetical protein ACKOTZ_13090 [Chloroflexota bacterium]
MESRRDGGDGEGTRAADLKRWTTEALGLDSAVTVVVAEVACADPGCPPTETLIAVLLDGGRLSVKLPGRIASLDRSTVLTAVHAAAVAGAAAPAAGGR